MYNRYIPQADGTFQKNRYEDKSTATSPPVRVHTQPSREINEPFLPKPNTPAPHRLQRPPCPPQPRPKNTDQNNSSITGFFKQLIPKDFDTTDLMIILLLLIISGDCAEDQNTALLTLMLYLFL